MSVADALFGRVTLNCRCRRLGIRTAGLPTDQRLAWSLRYLEGEPLDVIAAACRCSLATVKRRVSAAKKVIDEVFFGDRDE